MTTVAEFLHKNYITNKNVSGIFDVVSRKVKEYNIEISANNKKFVTGLFKIMEETFEMVEKSPPFMRLLNITNEKQVQNLLLQLNQTTIIKFKDFVESESLQTSNVNDNQINSFIQNRQIENNSLNFDEEITNNNQNRNNQNIIRNNNQNNNQNNNSLIHNNQNNIEHNNNKSTAQIKTKILKEKIIKRCIHSNTCDKNFFKNSHKYLIDFEYTNVTEINFLNFYFTNVNFNVNYYNNRFDFIENGEKQCGFDIDIGNYTFKELAKEIETGMNNNTQMRFKYSVIITKGNKLQIDYISSSFLPTSSEFAPKSVSVVKNPLSLVFKERNSIGHFLGFEKVDYHNKKSYTSENLFNGDATKFLYIVFDDQRLNNTEFLSDKQSYNACISLFDKEFGKTFCETLNNRIMFDKPETFENLTIDFNKEFQGDVFNFYGKEFSFQVELKILV